MSQTEQKPKSFAQLLRLTLQAGSRYRELQQELSARFLERYGVHYSDVDADQIIDSVDYSGGIITLAKCDEEMTRCGYPPLNTTAKSEDAL